MIDYTAFFCFYFLSVSRCPSEWHKCHMAAISSVKFNSLLKNNPEFYGCKSHMAAFVLTQGERHKGLIEHRSHLRGSLLLSFLSINFNRKTGR